jgi:threonine dehydratase
LRTPGTPDIDIARIRSAHEHIDPIFLNTPVAGHHSLDRVLGCSVLAKVETLNPIRSFKGRGTELFAARELGAQEVVICASAGNFGQGMARASAGRGHRCIVFAATNANPVKVEAMRSLGAEVVLAGDDFDSAKLAARKYAEELNARFVEDGAEPAIAEGAGTIGLELLEAVPDLAAMLVPLGNGALLAGVGAAFRYGSPRTQIIAVVAEQAPSMKLSLEQGRVIETPRADTIADGVAVRVPVPSALATLSGRFDAVASVTEGEIMQAMRLVLEHLGLVVEPAGALGIAALLADPDRFKGQKVGTILCGANLPAGMLKRLVG